MKGWAFLHCGKKTPNTQTNILSRKVSFFFFLHLIQGWGFKLASFKCFSVQLHMLIAGSKAEMN